MQSISVLDHGYVRLVDHMGSDLRVVNAARVSFDKESFELSEADIKLIRFLAREDHTSPFRHAMMTFEAYAPLLVCRQWWRYITGSDHTMDANNESSRRYITEEPTFYIPSDWREAPANRKQGSGAIIPSEIGAEISKSLMDYINQGVALYEGAMARGVCAEQARLFLPAYGMYVRWYWTASLQSVCHFLNQRLESHAQWEIQEFARAVYALAKPVFPVSIKNLVHEDAD